MQLMRVKHDIRFVDCEWSMLRFTTYSLRQAYACTGASMTVPIPGRYLTEAVTWLSCVADAVRSRGNRQSSLLVYTIVHNIGGSKLLATGCRIFPNGIFGEWYCIVAIQSTGKITFDRARIANRGRPHLCVLHSLHVLDRSFISGSLLTKSSHELLLRVDPASSSQGLV